MSVVAKMVLNAADVIIATTVQIQTDLLKDIVLEHVIIDESSVLTHVERLCAWRGTEVLTFAVSWRGQNQWLTYGAYFSSAMFMKEIRITIIATINRPADFDDGCMRRFPCCAYVKLPEQGVIFVIIRKHLSVYDEYKDQERGV